MTDFTHGDGWSWVSGPCDVDHEVFAVLNRFKACENLVINIAERPRGAVEVTVGEKSGGSTGGWAQMITKGRSGITQGDLDVALAKRGPPATCAWKAGRVTKPVRSPRR